MTITPPGSVPRGAIGALGSSALGVCLLGAVATFGLADELPARIAYNELAFRLMTHKLLLVLSAVAALTSFVLACAAWKRSPRICSLAMVLTLVWVGLVAWARFANA